MKRILYCALLSLLAACLLAACDGFSLNSFSGQGAPCHSDKTCKSPLACIAGTCQPPGTDGDTQDSDLDTNEKDADEQSEQAEQIEQDGEPDSEAELPSDGDREGESEPLEDVTGPTITVTAPQGGTYAVTTKLSIQWTAGDSQSGIRGTDGFAIDLYQGSCGLGTTGSVAHIATLNGDMRGFDWTIPSGVPENGDYYIKVAAIDNALNWGFACSSRIAVSNPADGDLEMESDAEKEPDPDPDPDSADGDSAESEHDTTDGDSESEIEVPLTWLDTASGLTWQVTPPVDPLDHAAASMSCDTLDLGSYTDWRLPSISELRSLVRDCEKMQIGGACGVTDGCTTSTCLGSSCQGCSGSAPNGCYWPTASVLGACDWFWASTLNVEDQSQAWMIGFGNAYIGTDQMTKTHRLRCVRGTANWPVDGDLDTTDRHDG